MRRALGALLALASACVAKHAAADEGGLIIETGSPDALCPELSSTRAAVSRRLGELIVPGGSSGFRARYTIAHAPVGSPRDFVRLELYGPEGTLRLARDLPLEGESCSTMAEVIALVLDRYFRALLAHDPPGSDDEMAVAAAPESSSAPPSPAPLETPGAAGAREPSPSPLPSASASSHSASSIAASTDAGPSPDAAATPAPEATDRLVLAAFELGLRSPDMPALGVRVMLELWPEVYLGSALHVGLRSETETLSEDGEVSSRDATWRLDAGWGPRLGPVRTYIGPAVCLDVARGSGDGMPQQGSGYRATWAAGLGLGAQWVTMDRWSFGASGALEITVLSGRFDIDGEEVLVPEPVRAWFGMSVGRAF